MPQRSLKLLLSKAELVLTSKACSMWCQRLCSFAYSQTKLLHGRALRRPFWKCTVSAALTTWLRWLQWALKTSHSVATQQQIKHLYSKAPPFFSHCNKLHRQRGGQRNVSSTGRKWLMHGCSTAATQSTTGKEKTKIDQKPSRGSPARSEIQDLYRVFQIPPNSRQFRIHVTCSQPQRHSQMMH